MQNIIKKCNHAANRIRLDIIEMTYSTGSTGAHAGGSLSMAEIMSVLYCAVMKFDEKNPCKENRDRLILSKGHGVMAQYAALKHIGVLTKDDLKTFKKNGSFLYAHPSINPSIGIEFSSGSLGQGLSLGVGTALGLKIKKNFSSKVYVVLGDGECNEGQIWEAAMSASHFKLDNLVVVIDKNRLQYDGETDTILNLEPFEKKWESFGFKTLSVNGHNTQALFDAFNTDHNKQPMCIIAETIKGKGVSFMENQTKWHNGALSKEQYELAIQEIGGAL